MLSSQIPPPVYTIQGMVDSGSYPVIITMGMPSWGEPAQEAAIVNGIAAMVADFPGIVLTTVQTTTEQAGPSIQWEPPTQP